MEGIDKVRVGWRAKVQREHGHFELGDEDPLAQGIDADGTIGDHILDRVLVDDSARVEVLEVVEHVRVGDRVVDGRVEQVDV